MKTSTLRIAVLGLLVGALAVAPGQAFGQETKKEGKGKKAAAAEAEKAPNKQGVIPFRGKIGAVDKSAKTITVGERTFQITSETRIRKADKPATLDDAVVGEEIGGSYNKTDDGKLMARSIRIGPRPEGADTGKKDGEKKGKKKAAE